MKTKLMEPKLYTAPPQVCPKEDCGGTLFLKHEDGWQCFNCMKILYKIAEPKQKIDWKRYSRYQQEISN